jgi:hypothetical protein
MNFTRNRRIQISKVVGSIPIRRARRAASPIVETKFPFSIEIERLDHGAMLSLDIFHLADALHHLSPGSGI